MNTACPTSAPGHRLQDVASKLTEGPENSITMHDLTFGHDHEKPILHDITLKIPLSKITIFVGPVGSGKSILCKALLGEIPSTNGSVQFPQLIASIAFCDQTPWLPNETIRACIVGASDTDDEWYRTVLRTAELRHDLEQLTNGDLTLVRSNGIALSGGQKVRVALARALFTRTPLLILDDVLSGLDNATENKVCETCLEGEDFCAVAERQFCWSLTTRDTSTLRIKLLHSAPRERYLTQVASYDCRRIRRMLVRWLSKIEKRM